MPEVNFVFFYFLSFTYLSSRWVSQRKVFGKPLHSQAVIRSKLAAMISRVETAQNWLENITYQMNNMKYREQANYLAGHALFSVIYDL